MGTNKIDMEEFTAPVRILSYFRLPTMVSDKVSSPTVLAESLWQEYGGMTGWSRLLSSTKGFRFSSY